MFEETLETKSNAREPVTFAGKMLKYIHCDPRSSSSDIEEDSDVRTVIFEPMEPLAKEGIQGK